jgi:hypothetical protein
MRPLAGREEAGELAHLNRANDGLGSSPGLGELKMPGHAGEGGDEPIGGEQIFLLPPAFALTLVLMMAIGAVLAECCCPLLGVGLGDLVLLGSVCTGAHFACFTLELLRVHREN